MIASLCLQLFNAGLWDCWIYPHPQGCLESWRNNGTSNCERGDNASLYQWLFDVIPKWLSVFIVTFLMLSIHRSVLEKERATARFAMRGNRVARQMARQSYLYVGALYLTYIPVVITRMTEVLTGSVYYAMILSISIAIPLQGFWNLLVFLRPRFLESMKRRNAAAAAAAAAAVAASRGGSGSFALGMRLKKVSQAVSEAVRQGALDEEEVHDATSQSRPCSDGTDTPTETKAPCRDASTTNIFSTHSTNATRNCEEATH